MKIMSLDSKFAKLVSVWRGASGWPSEIDDDPAKLRLCYGTTTPTTPITQTQPEQDQH